MLVKTNNSLKNNKWWYLLNFTGYILFSLIFIGFLFLSLLNCKKNEGLKNAFFTALSSQFPRSTPQRQLILASKLSLCFICCVYAKMYSLIWIDLCLFWNWSGSELSEQGISTRQPRPQFSVELHLFSRHSDSAVQYHDVDFISESDDGVLSIPKRGWGGTRCRSPPWLAFHIYPSSVPYLLLLLPSFQLGCGPQWSIYCTTILENASNSFPCHSFS